MVEVPDQDADGSARPRGALDLPREQDLERAAVEQLRQRIGARRGAQAGDQAIRALAQEPDDHARRHQRRDHHQPADGRGLGVVAGGEEGRAREGDGRGLHGRGAPGEEVEAAQADPEVDQLGVVDAVAEDQRAGDEQRSHQCGALEHRQRQAPSGRQQEGARRERDGARDG